MKIPGEGVKLGLDLGETLLTTRLTTRQNVQRGDIRRSQCRDMEDQKTHQESGDGQGVSLIVIDEELIQYFESIWTILTVIGVTCLVPCQ